MGQHRTVLLLFIGAWVPALVPLVIHGWVGRLVQALTFGGYILGFNLALRAMIRHERIEDAKRRLRRLAAEDDQ